MEKWGQPLFILMNTIGGQGHSKLYSFSTRCHDSSCFRIAGNGFESRYAFCRKLRPVRQLDTKTHLARGVFSLAGGQGLESYRFSRPFGYIFPLVKFISKAFRAPTYSPPDCTVLPALKQNSPHRAILLSAGCLGRSWNFCIKNSQHLLTLATKSLYPATLSRMRLFAATTLVGKMSLSFGISPGFLELFCCRAFRSLASSICKVGRSKYFDSLCSHSP